MLHALLRDARAWTRLGLLALALLLPSTTHAAGPVQFSRDIRPILADTCFKCHGPSTQKGGLRLDQRESAVRLSDSGVAALVPGEVDRSELVRRILSEDEHEVMPPPSANKTLTAAQKELLKRWIAEGAEYQKHWAFERPRRPAAAPVEGVENPVDAWVVARLKDEGLSLSPEADRETLIRRVAFALTGLPPTLAEVDAFLADTQPEAYERLVDQYLRSPRYGEEMARHWLDVARYGDTHGLHLDNERQMWAYRDYVVSAFNQNKPFDQFTIEQLAGDLIPGAGVEQLVATGFNRCNVTTGEGGSIDDEWVFRNAVDRTSTMATVWLGLTAGCAVCHDHKYDPLTAKDFYSLYAFFHSAADPPLDGNALLTAPTAQVVSAADQAKLQSLDQQLAARRSELEQAAAALEYTDPATVDPRPEPQVVDSVWLDDELTVGGKLIASPGHPTQFVTADQGKVHAGTRALKRTDKGLAQDVVEGTMPLEIPADAKLFAYVWIDPADLPKTLMLQYFKGGWLHRAVWGDYTAIDWGKAGTTERVLVGELPKAGEWVRLEVAAGTVGLNAGDQVTGFALTQFGGTVYWDQIGVSGRSDPAADPRRSLTAWRSNFQGKDVPGAPAEVNAALKEPLDKPLSDAQTQGLRTYYIRQVCVDTRARLQPWQAKVDAVQRERDQLAAAIPSSFIFRDLEKPRQSFVMQRGQYDKPGDPVEPDVPAVLPPLTRAAGQSRANRLDLARWLTSAEQPLTARVTVNRFWQQLFGVGLVKTSFDFGSQGELPSHPELLDSLSVSFRESGWDVKGLLRQLLLSRTFRQSSVVTPDLVRLDPENRLYARGPRFRLDAEQLRDNALFVGGLLSPQVGGRGVNPYQPPNIWEPVGFVGSNTATYRQDHADALYRRSLYTFFKRTAPPPFMANFDAPNREQPCTRRERSNTPLQALQLMNDVQHYEAARGLAERIMTRGGATPDDRIVFAYRTVLARRPTADEQQIVERLFERERERYRSRPDAARQAIRNGESAPNDALDAPELAAWTLVSNLLLNLDETVSRN